ncbi:MAG TPA: lipid-binding SYLF domain-containing protein [Bryobacteraceae bacterium]|nr:lipid-binding SYLF domain-containing protein [Bryobacteraceae bacterium]
MTKTAFLVLVLASAAFGESAAERLSSSARVFKEIMATSDRGIPQDLLQKAECIVVVPGMKKGAFIVGGNFGRGFVSCRKASPGWSAPGAIRVEGGSFGFQIGASETDVIMLVLNKRGAEKLMASKFTVGGDASVAAGPVGRTSSAETDALMHAEMLSWSRSRGVFAGIALKGATLRPDGDANKDLYGSELETRQIVTNTPAPKAAGSLIALLNRYSSRK